MVIVFPTSWQYHPGDWALSTQHLGRHLWFKLQNSQWIGYMFSLEKAKQSQNPPESWTARTGVPPSTRGLGRFQETLFSPGADVVVWVLSEGRDREALAKCFTDQVPFATPRSVLPGQVWSRLPWSHNPSSFLCLEAPNRWSFSAALPPWSLTFSFSPALLVAACSPPASIS